MLNRPDWDSYFLMIANVVASRSTCIRRNVGAVLVKDQQILSTGYNGAPRGVIHCEEAGCLREKLGIPSGERHEICRGSHAEINAIAQAAYAGVATAGCWLYCTHEPCVYCTKALINCGCRRIVYIHPYPDKTAREIILQSGVETLCIPKDTLIKNTFSIGGNLQMFTREESIEFLKEHNKEEMHIKHAYAVEAAMRWFAKENGEDEDYWGLIGLMHDIDWEEFPSTDTHPMKGGEMLKEKGYPDDFVHSVLAHGWEYSGIKPESLCEKYLYTIDELTGFITAVALVRPSKSLQDLELKSVKKKWKDKAFARGVNREVIEKGSELLNIPLETLIEQTITALRPVEKEIGLGS